jgi:hypothetical protein
MLPNRSKLKSLISAAALLLALSSPAALAGGHTQQGEELVPPEMTAEQLDGVRATIKKFADYSDEQVLKMMAILTNESGTISGPETKGDIGLLVLAHGFHGEGFNQFTDAFAQATETYPTAYGFGLGIMSSEFMQDAVDSLEAQGAKTVVLLPTSTAKHSSMVRQWQYMLGTIDEPAFLEVPRVDTDAQFVWAPNPMNHPIAGEILGDHAKAVSKDPANELVLIMGHGPSEKEDNDLEIEILERHAAAIKATHGFSDVKVSNVQDDAPVEMREANVARLRGWISDAKAQGKDVIVTTTVLTEAGVLRKLEKDVEGLGVIFNDTGMMVHPRFADWLDETIQQSVAPLN